MLHHARPRPCPRRRPCPRPRWPVITALAVITLTSMVTPRRNQPMLGRAGILARVADDCSDERIETLGQRYRIARPFPHVELKDAFDTDLLERACNEAVTYLTAVNKETDLFKVLQVPQDLCGIEAANETLAKCVPSLLALRDQIRSDDFIKLLQNITGCGELDRNRIDCSVNAYVKGNHLLCHDDHIGSRRLSFILYLVEESSPWDASEGGRLELYPKNATSPSRWILPKWNSMVVFEVKAGKTLHAVEEVYGDRPRLSISGWYHRPQSAKQSLPIESSSSSFLSSSSREALKKSEEHLHSSPWIHLRGLASHLSPEDQLFSSPESRDPPLEVLSSQDREFLSHYISPFLLQNETIRRIHQELLDSSSTVLKPFLKLESLPRQNQFPLLLPEGSDEKMLLSQSSLGCGWHEVGPPHMRRYLQFDARSKMSLGKSEVGERDLHCASKLDAEAERWGLFLSKIRDELMFSEQFQRFIATLTGIRTIAGRAEIRLFRRGRDYRVAIGKGLPNGTARVDITLLFSGGKDIEWETSNTGGFDAYVVGPSPDREEQGENLQWQRSIESEGENQQVHMNDSLTKLSDSEEAAICRTDDAMSTGMKEQQPSNSGDTLLTVDPSFNALSIVFRDAGTTRFVKYLEKEAPGNRLDLTMEFAVCDADAVT